MKRTAVVVGAEVFAVANPAPRFGGPVWLFVRLDTDAGISGYGEIFTSSVFTRPLGDDPGRGEPGSTRWSRSSSIQCVSVCPAGRGKKKDDG